MLKVAERQERIMKIKSSISLILVTILSSIFVFCLLSYLIEEYKYKKIYKDGEPLYLLSKTIDISKPNVKYTYTVKHTVPLIYEIRICSSALKPIWTDDELAKRLDYELRVILINDNKEVIQRNFMCKGSSYPCFLGRYTYNKEKNPIFNFIVEVVKPETIEKFSRASVIIVSFPPKMSPTGSSMIIIIPIGALLLMAILNYFLICQKRKEQFK